MRILSNVNILGTLDLDNVQNAAADTDRFLVQDANGVVKFRTGAEVASDIGASVGFVSTVKHEVKLGEAISTGQAVYVTSADGTNMIVSKASNATDATSSKTLGLIQTGGIANDIRYVITEGLLAGLNTSTAVAGDPVWLGTNGNLLFGVANKPVAPAHMVFIGIVTRVQSNNGEIFVKVQNGFELEELHNVLITGTPVDKAVIQYDTASGLWKNSALGGVTGTGAAGQVAFWNSANTQTGSNNLFWDAANNRLGVNNNTPSFSLDVTGSIRGAGSTSNYSFISTNSGSSSANSWRFGTSWIGNYDTSLVFAYNNNTRLISFGTNGFVSIEGRFETSIAVNTNKVVLAPVNHTNTNISFVNGASLSAQAGNHLALAGWDSILFATGGTEKVRIDSNGNVGIGVSSPTARLHLLGGGNTSASNALVLQDSAGVNIYTFRNDGQAISSIRNAQTEASLRFTQVTPNNNAGTNIPLIWYENNAASQRAVMGGYWQSTNQTGFTFRHGEGTTGIAFQFNSPSNQIINSSILTINETFNPTSGTSFRIFTNINPTINQTGGANGATYGLYINPTLTAAADWRSIQWTNNTGWGLYGSGTAANYLNGSLGIGITTIAASLSVSAFSNTLGKALILRNSSGVDGSSVSIDFETSSGTTGTDGAMAGRISGLRVGGGTTGALTFATTNAGVLTERMRLDASGNLGIGTTSPVSKLHVQGTIAQVNTTNLDNNTAVGLTVSYPDTTLAGGEGIAIAIGMNGRGRSFIANNHPSTSKDYSDIVFYNEISAVVNERMRILGTGYIKINAYGTGAMVGTPAYNLAVDASGNIIETAGGVVDGSGTANYISKWQDANTLTNSLLFDNGTNVGINSTVPLAPLTIHNPTANAAILELRGGGGSSQSRLLFTYGNGTSQTDQNALILANSTALSFSAFSTRYISFDINAVERMRIDASGNLGLGSSTINGRFHITHDSGGTPNFISQNTASGSWNRLIGTGSAANIIDSNNDLIIRTGASYVERMRLDASGNVGIGTSAPATKLNVNGIIRSESTTWEGNIISNSNGTSYSSFGWYQNGTKRWSFYNDDNAGNALSLANESGSVFIKVLQTGNVGIGSATPISRLSVKGVGDATGVTLTLENGGSILAQNDPLGIIDFYSNDISVGAAGVRGSISLRNEFGGHWDGNPIRENTYFSFSTSSSRTVAERMRISSNGAIRLNSYGTGTITGTAAYNLAVDASGNIIETAGGVIDGSGTASYIPRWSDPNTLTNSFMYDTGTSIILGGTTIRVSDASDSKLVINGGGTNAIAAEIVLCNETANDAASNAISFTGIRTNYSISGQLKVSRRGIMTFHTQDIPAAGAPPERMRIDASGNLSIGATSASYRLDVVGSGIRTAPTAGATGLWGSFVIGSSLDSTSQYFDAFRITGSGNSGYANTSNNILFQVWNGTAWNSQVFINQGSGAVGIGASPGFKLDVVSSIGYNSIVSRGASGAYFETYTIGGTRHASFGSESNGDLYLGSRSNNPLIFITNNTSVGRIDANGNLLFGSTSDAYIQGNRFVLSMTGVTDTLISFKSSATSLGYIYASTDSIDINANSRPITFSTTNSEKARILNNGNFGIGTTTPSVKLDVSGSTRTDGQHEVTGILLTRNRLQINNGRLFEIIGSSTAMTFVDSSAGATRITLDASGNLGLGVTPDHLLHIAKSSTTAYSSSSASLIQPDGGSNLLIQNSGTGGFTSLRFAPLNGSYAVGYIGFINTSGVGGSFVVGQRTGGSSYAEQMRLDASGNLGLGVVPSAWGSAYYKALELTGGALTSYQTASVELFFNSFDDASSSFKYKNTGFASRYVQVAGEHRWFTAPSGTAGATITYTRPMTLDASGRLLLGATSASTNGLLQINGDLGFQGNRTVRIASNSDGETLTYLGTRIAISNTNSFTYGYADGALIASVANSDNISLIDSGRYSGATIARFKVSNTTSGDVSFSLIRGTDTTFFASTLGRVGIGTSSINAAAKLQVDSTTSGFLPPRMTAAQRAAIASVPVGLVVYQTDGTEGLYIYTNANGWKSLAIVN